MIAVAETRLTKQRKTILQVLCQSEKVLTAQEIHAKVSSIIPKISLGTVYRNLDLLTKEKTIIKEIYNDGTARYRYLPDSKHHHQLICLGCGETTALPCCPVNNTINDFVSKNSFQPEFHKFDIYGYCKKCTKR